MKQLAIVAVAGAGIITFLILHKYGGGLLIGIAFGAVYFLKAVTSGNGIGEVRLTQPLGTPRKPIDPTSSIGMGMAAAGIASGAMGYPDFAQSLGAFLPIAVVLGVAIAVGYAIYGMKQESGREISQDSSEKNGTKSNGK